MSLRTLILVTLLAVGCSSQPKQEPQKQQTPHCFRVSHEDGSTTVCHQITHDSYFNEGPCPCGMKDTPPTVQKITCGPSKEPIDHTKTMTLEEKLRKAAVRSTERESAAPVASPDCSGGR